MKVRTLLLCIFGLYFFSTGSAQDLHFSNYHYSPLYLSPANTGAFAGSFRIGAQVREQFSSFINEPYQTLTAFADIPLALGFKPHHWLGAGINVYADQAGDLNFQNNGAHLSVAYHYAFDPKYKTILTLGLQFGTTNRKINGDNYRSVETLSGNMSDPDRLLLQDFNPNIADFNLGLNFKKWTAKNAYLDLGVSLYHLMESRYEFSGSSTENRVARRINVFGAYHIQTTKQLAIRPVLVYSRMFNFQNLAGQFNLQYKPNKKKETLIKAGLGYRAGDALQFIGGLIYKGWDIGVSYDLTVSTAQAFTNGNGGLEIGIQKIFVVKKKPKIVPVLLCPRY